MDWTTEPRLVTEAVQSKKMVARPEEGVRLDVHPAADHISPAARNAIEAGVPWCFHVMHNVDHMDMGRVFADGFAPTAEAGMERAETIYRERFVYKKEKTA